MKVLSVTKITSPGNPLSVADCAVCDGYIKAAHGSLPDVDCDFDAKRRDDIKAYLESRYNKEHLLRVFSAGTFSTIKMKGALKDVSRIHKLPVASINYLTAILDDDEMTWTDFMRRAATDKRLRDFVRKHPEVFEEMLPLFGQARAASIHASAVITTPEYIKGERVECYDLLPMKKMGDLLVSELSGAELDEVGFLKSDILGIAELGRLSDVLELVRKEYGLNYTILELVTKYLDDPKVFELLKAGFTQGVFQISGEGMTKFLKRLEPNNIEDLIATVALFRPATLASGSTDRYVDIKKGLVESSYLWGTENALKSSLSVLCYQEQLAMIAREVGGFSLGDGVKLVKLISKKKVDKIRAQKDKFMSGAKKNGCPQQAAEAIWEMFEVAGTYLFNRSHAVAYGLTAYMGAWLKTYYPTAFYTVILRDQDEDKLPVLMNEIASNTGTRLLPPDINISGENFVPDFKNDSIYWSLSRIKQLGPRAVTYILNERNLCGGFVSLEDFIRNVFKSKFKSFNDEGDEEARERCPVTARTLRQLIFAGAFDNIENITDNTQRYRLLEKGAEMLGFKLGEDIVPADMRDKAHWWSKKQIAVSGLGAIDYKAIMDLPDKPGTPMYKSYIDFKDLNNPYCGISKGMVSATITEVTTKTYKDKQNGENRHFGKVSLQQNTETNVLTIWDAWDEVRDMFKNSEGKFLVALANVKWSDYDEKCVFQINKNLFIKVL